MVRLLAPIMSFTCEEVWKYLPKVPQRAQSVHVAHFPGIADILGGKAVEQDPAQDADWNALRAVRAQVLKALEEERDKKRIGKALEAVVHITAGGTAFAALAKYRDELRYLFLVSGVTLEQASSAVENSAVVVKVEKAAGQKCERCWNYSLEVGKDPDYPTVCERCSEALKEIEAADPVR